MSFAIKSLPIVSNSAVLGPAWPIVKSHHFVYARCMSHKKPIVKVMFGEVRSSSRGPNSYTHVHIHTYPSTCIHTYVYTYTSSTRPPLTGCWPLHTPTYTLIQAFGIASGIVPGRPQQAMELQVLFLGRLEIFADLLQDERCRLKTETVYGLLLVAFYYGMWLFSACHRACLWPGLSSRGPNSYTHLHNMYTYIQLVNTHVCMVKFGSVWSYTSGQI